MEHSRRRSSSFSPKRSSSTVLVSSHERGEVTMSFCTMGVFDRDMRFARDIVVPLVSSPSLSSSSSPLLRNWARRVGSSSSMTSLMAITRLSSSLSSPTPSSLNLSSVNSDLHRSSNPGITYRGGAAFCFFLRADLFVMASVLRWRILHIISLPPSHTMCFLVRFPMTEIFLPPQDHGR